MMLNVFRSDQKKLTRSTKPLRSCGKTGTINVDGIDIAYWSQGERSPKIVFLHGNSAGKEVFHLQMAALRDAGIPSIAFDLPGHGQSSNSKNPSADYNFPSLALLLKKAMAELNINKPLIVGWSLGGHIAIEMAGRGFDMSGAMIFGTPPMGPGLDDFETAFVMSPAMAVTLEPEPTPDQLDTYVQGLYGSLKDVPEAFHQLANRTDGAIRSCIGEHWGQGDHGCHQPTVVAGWDKPLCVAHGENDAFVSGEYLSNLRWANLWGGEVHRFTDSGHAPFLETPDRFNRLLIDFAAVV